MYIPGLVHSKSLFSIIPFLLWITNLPCSIFFFSLLHWKTIEMNPSLVICLVIMAANLAWAEMKKYEGKKIQIGSHDDVVVFEGKRLTHKARSVNTYIHSISQSCAKFNSEKEMIEDCFENCIIYENCDHFEYTRNQCPTMGKPLKMGASVFLEVHFDCVYWIGGLKENVEMDSEMVEENETWNHYDMSDAKQREKVKGKEAMARMRQRQADFMARHSKTH